MAVDSNLTRNGLESEERQSDLAYRTLRDRIVRIEYQPLEPLNDRLLSDELQLGLSPIREALRRLESDHLVSIFPRRGTFVSEIGIRDEEWIREVRLEIEGLAARLAADRATAQECAAIVDIAERDQREGRLVRHIDLDAEFHRAIYSASRNPFLQVSVSHYFNLALRIWYYCDKTFELAGDIELNHLETAYSIRDRDADRAAASIRQHIRSNAADLRRIFADHGL